MKREDEVRVTQGAAPQFDLDSELAVYEGMRQSLEAHHMGEWVVVHQGKLIGTYDSFESAAKDAVSKFGRAAYLIRQVGAPSITLPASVAFFQYGANRLRLR